MSRPAITGIGVVSSIGLSREDFWRGLEGSKSGIGQITLFDTSGFRGRLGAEVRGPLADVGPLISGALPHIPPGLRCDRFSRCDRFGVLAFIEAVRDSGLRLDDIPPDRVAVVIGSGSGGLYSAEAYKRQVHGGRKPRPSLLVPFTSSALSDCLAALSGSKGYRATISTACSSSTTAIGMAGEIIKKGLADVVVTGGSESLSETTFSGFNALRAVDEQPCRPFDRERKGISLGEGAAIFIVEDLDRSGPKKAYAQVGGYGLSADAYHVTAPSPDGLSIAEAIRQAVKASGIDIADIGYINAHGTATQANDLAETNAVKAVFGKRAYAVPISSTKSMIGHCLGAAGALEAAASVLAIYKGVIPATISYENPDPMCDLDYVPNKPRRARVNAVLSNSLAFGGNNTALILKAP